MLQALIDESQKSVSGKAFDLKLWLKATSA